MKYLFIILFFVSNFVSAQNLRKQSSDSSDNTMWGNWWYRAHPTYSMNTRDSIKIADYKLVKDSAIFDIFRIAGNDSIFFRRGYSVFAIKDSAGNPNAFLRNGNSFGGLAVLGTNDNNALDIELNGTTRHRFQTDGTFSVFTTNDVAELLYVNGNSRLNGQLRFETTGNGLSALSGVAMQNFGANGPSTSILWSLNNIYQNSGTNKIYMRIAADVTTNGATTQTIDQFVVSPTINNTLGTTTVRGFYYNPTLTSVTNTTNIAFENTSGFLRFKAVPTAPSTYTLFVHSLQSDSNLYQIPSSTFTTPAQVGTQIQDSLGATTTIVRSPLITYEGAGSDPDTLATLGLNGLGTAGQSIRINAGETGFEYYTPATVTTLYTGDDTLAGNRTVTMSSNTLNFTGGNVGISTSGPDRLLDILSNAAPQLRLTHTDGSVYTDFQTDGNGIQNITPTGRYLSIPTGSTSNRGYVPNVIWNETDETATSGTGETDLYSYTTPATTLGTDGEWLEYSVEGIFNPNETVAGATMTLRAYWAGTEVIEVTSTSATAYTYVMKIRVVRTSSTNARVTAYVIGGSTSFSGVGSDRNPRVTNITTTFTNTNILKTTGQTTDGTQGLNVQSADIKWFPQNLPGT